MFACFLRKGVHRLRRLEKTTSLRTLFPITFCFTGHMSTGGGVVQTGPPLLLIVVDYGDGRLDRRYCQLSFPSVNLGSVQFLS
jgi:hypothetical protein